MCQTENNYINPTKYVLRMIDPRTDEVSNYRRVLEQCWSAETNLSVVSLLSDENLKTFYGQKPSDTPRFISIYSHADCNKLASVFDRSFIIYEKRVTVWRKFFDSRTVDRVLEKTFEYPPLCFLIAYTKTSLINISLASPDNFIPLIAPECSENYMMFSCTSVSQHDADYLQSACYLIHGNPGPKNVQARSIFDLCDVNNSEAILTYLQRDCLIVVTHVKSILARCSNCKPGSQKFAILAVLRRVDSPISNIANSPVIAICNSGCMYIPRPEFATYIKDRQKLFREKISKSEFAKGEKVRRLPQVNEKISPCECALCKSGNKYVQNMSPDGPQGLFKTQLDSWEYLRWMNLDTIEHRHSIIRACNISTATFDIESKTEKLVPNAIDEIPMHYVGWYRHHGGLQFRQECILFAHLDSKEITRFSEAAVSDSFQPSLEELEEIKLFSVQTSLQDTINGYIDYVLLRQEWASKLKKEILKDLFLFLERMKQQHMMHFEEHEIEKDYALSTWKATMFGKFELHLLKLVRSYYSFSFNGSSYDHVLFAPVFSCVLKNRGIHLSE